MSHPDTQNQDQQAEPENTGKINFWSLLQTTLAAAFGVQSSKNRSRDFQQGNIWVFIACGIIFTVLFIFTVLSVVRLVLAS